MRAPPLHPAWLTVIDDVARELLGRDDRAGPALAEAVAALSEVYNRRVGTLRVQEDAHAARLRFFLPRDLPKVGGPLAELAFAGALPAGPTWRVLDLGAGLGTTGLGVASFAATVGVARIDVHAVERDGPALRVYRALAEQCGRGTLAGVTAELSLTTEVADLRTWSGGGAYDLIVVGLALNELFASTDDTADPAKERAAWLARLAPRLAPGGSLVVVEPALRDVTRGLMAVRDLVAQGAVPGLAVFGPCTHGGPCPMLPSERDWCHEVLSHDLPEPLQPVARAAGLRAERLTYAALTLRADDRALAPGAWRVVAGPIGSKGKTEWGLCGRGRLAHVTRLDRHAGPGDPLHEADRGALLSLDEDPPERGRSDRMALSRVR